MTAALKSFARLPFIIGIARSMDLLGVFNQPMPYSHLEDGLQADDEAFDNDWKAIGEDFRTAAEELVGSEDTR